MTKQELSIVKDLMEQNKEKLKLATGEQKAWVEGRISAWEDLLFILNEEV